MKNGVNTDVNTWEKLKVITTLISSIVIPIVLLVISSNYNAAMKEKETRAKYLELATKILQEQTHPSNYKLRNWAVDVVNRYSEIPLPKVTQEQLIKDYKIVGQLVRINDNAEYDWIPELVDKYCEDNKFMANWDKIKTEKDINKKKQFLVKFASEIEHEIALKRNKEFNKLGIMTWPPYWNNDQSLLD